jgi:hypothetical protein
MAQTLVLVTALRASQTTQRGPLPARTQRRRSARRWTARRAAPTATAAVTTDRDDGTLWWVVTTSATTPSHAQIKAGQDHTGSAAAADGSQAVTATGSQGVSITGLTSETTYYTHFTQESVNDAAATPVSADGFTTDDVTAPTVDTLSPADDATGASITTAVLTLDENVQFRVGGGDILVYEGASLIETFTRTNSSTATGDNGGSASISGAAVTITYGADLTVTTAHEIIVENGCIEDTSGNAFAGLATGEWNFTTGAGSYDPVDASEDDIETLLTQIATLEDSSGPQDGGTLTINSEDLGEYDYTVVDGNTTISSFTVGDWFTSNEDSHSSVIVVKGDLTINAGQVLTPAVRKLFTALYVTGTLTVNGEISMTARGAKHSTVSAAAIRIATGTYGAVANPEIPSSGGSGAAGVQFTNSGGTGSTGTGGATGGGGSGAHVTGTGRSGAGADGTSFSGGSGGASGSSSGVDEDAGDPNGGEGGSADDANSGGGAGNPGGAGVSNGINGEDGTGGVLIIKCATLAGSGEIRALGSDGGSGNNGGGASGGGSITVLAGTDSSSITPSAAGGTGGAGSPGRNGGDGGAGTSRVIPLA